MSELHPVTEVKAGWIAVRENHPAGPPGIAPPGPSLQQRTCWSSDYNVDPTCVAPWQNGYLGIQGPYLNP